MKTLKWSRFFFFNLLKNEVHKKEKEIMSEISPDSQMENCWGINLEPEWQTPEPHFVVGQRNVKILRLLRLSSSAY